MNEAAPSRYEKTDAHIRSIVIFGAVLVGLVSLVLFSMTWMFDFFMARWAVSLPSPPPLAEAEQPPVRPPVPLAAGKELNEMLAAEDSVLDSYGWVDREKGVVRIPIERAIELLAERGLPVRQQGESKMEDRG